jgi:hypothetical protein
MLHPDRCAYCGTISEGTLSPEDLIPRFVEALAIRLDELEREQHVRGRSLSGEVARALQDLEEVELRTGAPEYYDSEDADEDLEWLQEILGHFAPPGHWFGAHPGDGADFGFWPLDLLEDGQDGDGGSEVGAAAAAGRQLAAPAAASTAGSAFPERGDTHIETWFERDRAHVALYESKSQSLIAEWWDGEVTEAVEDGFLNPRDYHGSAYSYARQLAGGVAAE